MKNLNVKLRIAIYVFLINICLHNSLNAQDSDIIANPFINALESAASEKQKEIISIIKNRITTSEMRLVKLVDFQIDKSK